MKLCQRKSRVARGRGFALPMVLLVIVVALTIVSAMLGRQEVQGRAVARQAQATRDWHFSRGIQEVVNAWVRSRAAVAIREQLGADGKAFDLLLEDGSLLSLYMADAQGTVLSDTSGLSVEDTIDARAIIEHLRESLPADRLAALTRGVGPPGVSIYTASPEVLAAVTEQAVGPELAQDCVREILDLRASHDRVTVNDMNEVATGLGLNDAQKRSLQRLVAIDPGLYRFVLDVRGSEGAPPAARYAGYLVARASVVRTGARAGITQGRTAFLKWEKVFPR